MKIPHINLTTWNTVTADRAVDIVNTLSRVVTLCNINLIQYNLQLTPDYSWNRFAKKLRITDFTDNPYLGLKLIKNNT